MFLSIQNSLMSKFCVRTFVGSSFFLFSACAIVVFTTVYLSYSDYNNTKVVETQCVIISFNIEKSRCGKTTCYKGYIILNVTSINEFPVSYLYTYSDSYATTFQKLQNNFTVQQSLTCYYQVSNTQIIELNHEHKPEEGALIAGLVLISLAGFVLLFEIIIELYWFYMK